MINKVLITLKHSNLQFSAFQLVRQIIIHRENHNETQGIKSYEDFITGSV